MVVSFDESSQPASLEDGEVVRRVLCGETALFEVLMRRHDERVSRTVRSILRNEDEAADAVQQAWFQAYLHLADFEAAAALSTWLVRIAVNEALQSLRRRSRRARIRDAMEEQAIDSTSDPEDRVAAREAAHLVGRAAERLPVPYRAVFVLREMKGLSTADAAAALYIGEAATKVRLHRARAMLRRALDDATTGHGVLERSSRPKAFFVLTNEDVARLRRFVERHGAEIDRACAEKVAARLALATIVAPREVPREVVTMNSRVLLEDSGGGMHEVALVYSPAADLPSGHISVFTPLGAGVLGLSAGERIDSAPGTTGIPLRIVSIPYQPEAAGHFSL
jgi:RNA polymerase sigma-70 factor (ECF subfamily)